MQCTLVVAGWCHTFMAPVTKMPFIHCWLQLARNLADTPPPPPHVRGVSRMVFPYCEGKGRRPGARPGATAEQFGNVLWHLFRANVSLNGVAARKLLTATPSVTYTVHSLWTSLLSLRDGMFFFVSGGSALVAPSVTHSPGPGV